MEAGAGVRPGGSRKRTDPDGYMAGNAWMDQLKEGTSSRADVALSRNYLPCLWDRQDHNTWTEVNLSRLLDEGK